MILVLVGVLLFGKEVNGAKAWIMLGPVAIQPTEFAKFTTALALARYMSSYTFDIRKPGDLLRAGMIVGLPVLIVILQNDTGSALVYGSFLFMFYREGFNGWVYVAKGCRTATGKAKSPTWPDWRSARSCSTCCSTPSCGSA